MSHPDIVRLALGEIDGPIDICSVPASVAVALGSSARRVWLSRATIEKQFRHHPEFRVHHVDDFDWMIANGEPYLHHKGGVVYFICSYRTEFQHRYKITVKATKRRHQLWLTSAHPCRSLTRLLRNATPVVALR
jgi:hypothetical protein